MSTPPIGALIDGDAGRDAIHIAIAPLTAMVRLYPGQHFALAKDDSTRAVANGRGKVPLGIVDPYLAEPVEPGQRFWGFLYPNTVTSLRHEWTHPAFVEKPKASDLSERWLRDFADSAGLSYDDLLRAAKAYLDHGDCLIDGGRWEGFSTPDELWDHYEVVTGEKVPASERGGFFSCSC